MPENKMIKVFILYSKYCFSEIFMFKRLSILELGFYSFPSLLKKDEIHKLCACPHQSTLVNAKVHLPTPLAFIV